MNTNTYRCECGRILGYLASGAKEACTTCLQVRRQDAIAKAGARGTHVPESERASCAQAPTEGFLDAVRYVAREWLTAEPG